MKEISGAGYIISKIFSSEFEFVIPPYQRPYSWTCEHSGALFNDLYDFYMRNQDEEYFLGSIVLIKDEKSPRAEVVDGQQRLTTLTILLATLIHFAEEKDKETLKKYILEPGNEYESLETKPRLTLREQDREFFYNYIQRFDFDELINLESAQLKDAQLNLKNNTELFFKDIKNRFQDYPEKLKEFLKFILCKCSMVVVSTSNEQAAFRVFTILNDRGLDLQPTDILKADIIGKIDKKEQSRYNELWEDLEEELGRATFNTLFSHIRMILSKKKQEKTLIEEFRDYVLPKYPSHVDLFSKVLEPYAEAFSILRTSSYQSTSKAEEVNHYIAWLNKIEYFDWFPPAILFMSKYKSQPQEILTFFKLLEQLTAYMFLSGENVNSRIGRYARIIKEIERDDNCFENIFEATRLKKMECENFLQLLQGDIYSLLNPSKRKFLMLRLDSFLSDNRATYNSANVTLEHVLPQNLGSGSDWIKYWTEDEHRKWIHKIANLVLLNKRRNSKAQNYDFEKKKNAYFLGKEGVSSFALTSQVLQFNEWTPSILEKRHKELLDVVATGWDLRK